MKIAVVTDTNSSMTKEDAASLGVHLLSMPFIVNGTEYFEGVNCTYEQFFQMLAEGADVSTSQPSPKMVTDLWDELLKTNDAVIHMPMSSALSSSTATAKALAAADYQDKVFVVDNKRISITLYQAVVDTLAMIEKQMTPQQIVEALEKNAYDCSIYLAVNTLELLKKSGRVTAAGAMLATILGLKPVLQIQGEKLDAFAKARGMANAEKVMLEAAKKDIEERFAGRKVKIMTAYSGDIEPAKQWLKKVREYFGDKSIQLYKLPISISCHVGAGVKAIGCMPEEEI